MKTISQPVVVLLLCLVASWAGGTPRRAPRSLSGGHAGRNRLVARARTRRPRGERPCRLPSCPGSRVALPPDDEAADSVRTAAGKCRRREPMTLDEPCTAPAPLPVAGPCPPSVASPVPQTLCVLLI